MSPIPHPAFYPLELTFPSHGLSEDPRTHASLQKPFAGIGGFPPRVPDWRAKKLGAARGWTKVLNDGGWTTENLAAARSIGPATPNKGQNLGNSPRLPLCPLMCPLNSPGPRRYRPL